MDSHHDQVMKAIAKAGDGKRLYFAYSTVLDPEAFATWKQQHGYDAFSLPEGKLGEALGTTVVFDFPSRFWGGRVAGLAPAEGESVFGRVFEISEKDWPIVQHKEGAVTGMAVEQQLDVKIGNEVVEATAFITNPSRVNTDGPVSAQFVEAITRGAKAAALPDAWLQKLATLAK
jgi:gamma-glutamylcyclotransferase